MIVDALRDRMYRAIQSPTGDAFAAVRVPKDLARRLNTLLGSPLCTTDELARRKQGAQRLAELRARGPKTTTPVARPTAPVQIYFEKDRNAGELRRMREALDAKGIAYSLLDVAGDEVTLEFVTRTSGKKSDELPVVFVGGAPIGGYRELVDADVSGALAKALAG